MSRRILLSGPDVSASDREALLATFDDGWIAPAGPQLARFEAELCAYTGGEACVALSSGTAALHLALLGVGVVPGDRVLVQSATFAATAFAVVHAGAVPVFIDSEATSWCVDPGLLSDYLESQAQAGSLPKAILPVDVYGSTADYPAITEICDSYGLAVVRDAAESLGSVSTTGRIGDVDAAAVLSFNGNKIITSSGGGALLGDRDMVDRARYLATQAKEPLIYYEHEAIGFNYRMSNLLAGLGSSQLSTIEDKIQRRSHVNERYRAELPDFTWCDYAHTPRPNHWLSVALLPRELDATLICKQLETDDIEARPAWKPMHLQPVFAEHEYVEGDGSSVAVYENGLCLPSSSALTDEDIDRVIAALTRCL